MIPQSDEEINAINAMADSRDTATEDPTGTLSNSDETIDEPGGEELDDYDDDKADDPERIARDTRLPPDSTTPDDLLPGNLTTHPGGSLGVPTGSGATGAYSSGESEDSPGSDTTSAGGDTPD